MNNFCIIMTRHVSSDESNQFWIHNVECIRKLYADVQIIIIDDHSIQTPQSIVDENIRIIQSSMKPGNGELLPYYYYLQNKFSKKALIIHDSCFIHKKIQPHLDSIDTYRFLWNMPHTWDKKIRIQSLLEKLNNCDDYISLFNDKTAWYGCFGAMCIITYEYLSKVFQDESNMRILLDNVYKRKQRMDFERVIAILLVKHDRYHSPIMGSICDTNKSFTSFNEYLSKHAYNTFEKVNCGR